VSEKLGGGPTQRHVERGGGGSGQRQWGGARPTTAIPHEAGELKGGGDADKWTRRQCGTHGSNEFELIQTVQFEF
jgi:hypothetical protein